jgi:hypothetical protein
MIHNLVKYFVQTRLRYFYISQTKSSLDNIFYKVVYHHIIYMCDFSDEFKRVFYRDLHEFSQRVWFALDTMPYVTSPRASSTVSYPRLPFFFCKNILQQFPSQVVIYPKFGKRASARIC